jgi:hypothetical protein
MMRKRIVYGTLVVVAVMFGVAQAALVHQYHFEDGTTNDYVGGTAGTLVGDATVAGGSLIVDGAGDWMEMPGPTIAINTFSELTLELWSTQPEIDQTYSMTASFGSTWENGLGKDYLMISTTRGDQTSRAAIANTPDQDAPWADEVGLNGPELNDGLEHQYVLTIGPNPDCTCSDELVLTYYIDGEFMGMAPLGATTIGGLSNDFGYLGKGTYSVDPTMQASINEFNIYDVALSCDEVQANYAAGPIPEPTTIALLGLGSLALIRRRRS